MVDAKEALQVRLSIAIEIEQCINSFLPVKDHKSLFRKCGPWDVLKEEYRQCLDAYHAICLSMHQSGHDRTTKKNGIITALLGRNCTACTKWTNRKVKQIRAAQKDDVSIVPVTYPENDAQNTTHPVLGTAVSTSTNKTLLATSFDQFQIGNFVTTGLSLGTSTLHHENHQRHNSSFGALPHHSAGTHTNGICGYLGTYANATDQSTTHHRSGIQATVATTTQLYGKRHLISRPSNLSISELPKFNFIPSTLKIDDLLQHSPKNHIDLLNDTFSVFSANETIRNCITRNPQFHLKCDECCNDITKEHWCWPCDYKSCSKRLIHAVCTIPYWDVKKHGFIPLCSEHWRYIAKNGCDGSIQSSGYNLICVGKDLNFYYFAQFQKKHGVFDHYYLPTFWLLTRAQEKARQKFYNSRGWRLSFEKVRSFVLDRKNGQKVCINYQRCKLNGTRVDACSFGSNLLDTNDREILVAAFDAFEKVIERVRNNIKRAKKNNVHYQPPKWWDSVQANNSQRTKWHILWAYTTQDPLKMYKSALELGVVFPQIEQKRVLRELKENLITASKAIKMPFDQYGYLLKNVEHLVLVGVKYKGGGLYYHIDQNFEGAVFVYFPKVTKLDKNGVSAKSKTGKSIAFGPAQCSFINEEGSMYAFWGKWTDYAMHCVLRAAGWLSYALIFRQRRSEPLNRCQYPLLDKERYFDYDDTDDSFVEDSSSEDCDF